MNNILNKMYCALQYEARLHFQARSSTSMHLIYIMKYNQMYLKTNFYNRICLLVIHIFLAFKLCKLSFETGFDYVAMQTEAM